MQTYELYGKEYKVLKQIALKNEEGKIVGFAPLLDIPMMSDYQWQLGCLQGRIEQRHLYENHENVDEVIEKIKKYIIEHTTTDLYKQFCDKYKCCYDLIYGNQEEAVAV